MANRVLISRSASLVARLVALIARGLVELRTGDAAADSTLAQAVMLAEGSTEAQRLDPAARALAEAAWLHDGRAPELLMRRCEVAVAVCPPLRHGLNLGWLVRFGDIGEPVPELPEPSCFHVTGRWHEAAAWWGDHGFPYERAIALAETDDVDALATSVRLLNDLGATATAAHVSTKLAALGGRPPRPRRSTTRSHPAGLTAREAEILDLLTEGQTNAEIAATLTLSTRTVENHVASLLTKLGVGSRREAVQVATERGWVAAPR